MEEEYKKIKKNNHRKILVFLSNSGGISDLNRISTQLPGMKRRVIRDIIRQMERFRWVKRNLEYTTNSFPRICTLRVSITKTGEGRLKYYKYLLNKFKGEENGAD